MKPFQFKSDWATVKGTGFLVVFLFNSMAKGKSLDSSRCIQWPTYGYILDGASWASTIFLVAPNEMRKDNLENRSTWQRERRTL